MAAAGDVNVVDHKTWGKIQQRVLQTDVQHGNDLTQRLIDVCAVITDDAIDQRRRRLLICLRGHIELNIQCDIN